MSQSVSALLSSNLYFHHILRKNVYGFVIYATLNMFALDIYLMGMYIVVFDMTLSFIA